MCAPSHLRFYQFFCTNLKRPIIFPGTNAFTSSRRFSFWPVQRLPIRIHPHTDHCDVIGFKPLFKHSPGENLDHSLQGHYALVRGGIEPGPAANVLFRPEEVHGASGNKEAGQPLGERHRHVTHDARRVASLVPCRPASPPAAVRRSPGKERRSAPSFPEKPANCQRLESSLAEPLLLARRPSSGTGSADY